MKCIAGTFKTPASGDVYICCGFLPDKVKVFQGNANEETALWSIHMMRSANMVAGVTIDDDGTITPDAVDTGIQIYRGGHLVTAAESTTGTYLVKNDKDFSKAAQAGPTYSDINAWTLDSGYTGHWNAGCHTTYVGVGSRICIDRKWYVVTALSNDGDAEAEVTLSETGVPSGVIEAIKPMYDYMSAAAGMVTQAGFWIDATSAVLTAKSEIAYFEASLYDN